MKCYKCTENAIEKLTNYIVDLGKSIIVVRHVPSFVCPSCGEVMYSATVAKQLEQIVEYAKKNMMEIVVMNYPDKTA